MKKILRIVVMLLVAAVAWYQKSSSDGEPHPSTNDSISEVSHETENTSTDTSNSSKPRIELPKGDSTPKAAKSEPKPDPESEPETERYDMRGESAIMNAFRAKRSDVQVNYTGPVVHVLPYDNVGTPHQNWLMELSNGHTIKVSHNTALAPKLPGLKKGDRVTVYGEYEYNDKGGVIHWTHHDPGRRHIGGFIRYNGKKYE